MGDLATWCLVISRNTRQTGSLVRGNLAQDYVDTPLQMLWPLEFEQAYSGTWRFNMMLLFTALT